jgi:hypothetical protein
MMKLLKNGYNPISADAPAMRKSRQRRFPCSDEGSQSRSLVYKIVKIIKVFVEVEWSPYAAGTTG